MTVSKLATNLFGPGHSTGGGISTSAGSAITGSQTLVNTSGVSITIASLVLSGWILTTAGTSPVGNTVPVTATVEYPIGTTTNNMLQSGSTAITIPNNDDLVTDQITLTTAIPAGASFKVNITATPPNGNKYIAAGVNGGLGLSGVLSTTATAPTKEVLFIIGDSIQTNNGGGVTVTAASLGIPSIQMSISGTTAAEYGATPSTTFNRQVALAAKLGCTRFISDFGTNDFGGGTSESTLMSYLQAMRSAAAAQSILFMQSTMTPRASQVVITPTVLVSSGKTMTATVPDGTQFVVGKPYVISGATQTEYNTTAFVTATSATSVTFSFVGSATPTATTTTAFAITGLDWSSAKLQMPNSSFFASGSSSPRGVFNNAVRTGSFDGYIEWADACEPYRDSSRWLTGGENNFLFPAVGPIAVTTVVNTARFQSTAYTAGGGNTGGNGYVQWASGANNGYIQGVGSSNSGDISLYSAPPSAAIAIGDLFYYVTGTSTATNDGLHPRVAQGSGGGQNLILQPILTAFKQLIASTLTAGWASTLAVTSTTASLSCQAPVSGTAPYTYQWYRSTTTGFTPGAGNIIAGATSQTLNDSGLTANTKYFYRMVSTDSASNTSPSNEVQVGTTSAPPAPAFTCAPSSFQIGTTTPFTLTGSNTAWTSSTTISITGGSGAVLSGVTVSGQTITGNLSPGTILATLTFQDSTDSATASVTAFVAIASGRTIASSRTVAS